MRALRCMLTLSLVFGSFTLAFKSKKNLQTFFKLPLGHNPLITCSGHYTPKPLARMGPSEPSEPSPICDPPPPQVNLKHDLLRTSGCDSNWPICRCMCPNLCLDSLCHSSDCSLRKRVCNFLQISAARPVGQAHFELAHSEDLSDAYALPDYFCRLVTLRIRLPFHPSCLVVGDRGLEHVQPQPFRDRIPQLLARDR